MRFNSLCHLRRSAVSAVVSLKSLSHAQLHFAIRLEGCPTTHLKRTPQERVAHYPLLLLLECSARARQADSSVRPPT